MPSLTLNLLGTPAAQFDGKPFVLSAKPLVLLSLLAFQSFPGTPTTRDELAAWLWSDTGNPLANLSVTLNIFRKVLGAQSIASDERTRTLALNLESSCDALECLAVTHEPNPARWDEVWNAWNGVFLGFPDSSWDLQLAPPFQDWLSEVRGRLHEARRHLASRLAGLALEAGRYADAVTYLEHASPEASDPRETQAIQMMLALTALDRPEDAVLVHKALSDALHELDTKPSTDALAAFEMARDQQVAAARAVLAQLFPARSEGLNVPFVGRESDLEHLERLLPRSLEGIGWLTMITGEPGSGKTALARAAMQRLDARERIYLHCEGFGERNAPAWRGFDLICRNLVRRRRTVFDAMPTELRAVLARFLPDVLEPVTQDPQPGDERLLYAAIRTLLIHDDQPTLLFLDDLQWFDETSLGLVLELLRKPPPRGLLVIATFRDTEPPLTTNTQGIWARLLEVIHRDKRGQELALAALDLNAVEQLSSELQQPANTDWMHAQSGGNPLYLLEMFEANYTQPGRVPPDLEALIRTRIDTLPQLSIAREVLEACAVLGESTSLNEVKNVSGFDYDTTVQALGSLRDARLLQRAEARIQMNHNLTRDATLERMSLERGQVLNLRAGHVRREQVELAANHFWAATKEGQQTLSVEDMLMITDVFTATGFGQCVRGNTLTGNEWFERALATAPDPETHIRTLTRRARMYERLSKYDEAAKDLDQAELLALDGSVISRVKVMNTRGMLFANGFSNSKAAEEMAQKALYLLEGIETRDAKIAQSDAQNTLGVAYWLRNDVAKAEVQLRQALKIRRMLGDIEKIADALQNLGNVLALKRDKNAQKLFDEAVEIWKKLGNIANLAHCRINLGFLLMQLGNLEAAEAEYLEALRLINPLGGSAKHYSAFNNLGIVYFYMGRLVEARDNYIKALNTYQINQNITERAKVLGNVAEAEMRLGWLIDAKNNLDSAYKLLNNTPDSINSAEILFFLGEVSVLENNIEPAIQFYELALTSSRLFNRKDHEFSSLVRLSCLYNRLDLAETAQKTSLTPTSQAAIYAIQGEYEKARTYVLKNTDRFEIARFLLDLARLSLDQQDIEKSREILASFRVDRKSIGRFSHQEVL
jgi:tetratricopeptide (TPR) repeat protein